MTALGIFCYFVYTSYASAVSQAFIAVDESSGKCESVPIAITSSYLADYNGNWEGSPQFAYASAKYSFSFNNFQVSSFSEYQQMMSVYNKALAYLGSIAVSQNLPFNLLLWISFIRYYSVDYPTSQNFSSIGFGQLQYLQMTGAAQQIYNLANQITSSGSYRGGCPVYALTEFDMANAVISTYLDYDAYMNESTCYNSLPPDQFGYVKTIDDGSFRLAINIETFTLAMSVNLGYVRISDLTEASTEKYYLQFHNTSYALGQYYDQRNLEMEPMWCVQNVTEVPSDMANIQHLCFYSYSRAVGLPIMHHFGGDYNEPQYCNCSTPVGISTACNQFNLISGFVFYPIQNSRNESIDSLLLQQVGYDLQLLAKYNGDYRALLEDSYTASWTLAARVYGLQYPRYSTQSWYQTAFNFARIPSGVNGSLLIFNSMDTISHLVSTYKYSLLNGSCADSFTIDASNWKKLSSVSPVQLTQSYFKCYPTAESAFINAVGIATGNTQLAVPLIVLLLLPLLYGFLTLINHVPPKEEYNRLERTEAVEILAMVLLRLRDGKTRGIKPKGVLMSLTKELIAAAKEEGGFPDSDDEDEDEDEDGDNKTDDKDKPQRDPSRRKSRRPFANLPPREQDSDDEENYVDDDEGVEEGDLEANRTSLSPRKSKSRRTSGLRKRRSTTTGEIRDEDNPHHSQQRRKKKERQRMGVFTR
eukprot:scaffold967_cov173-Ochromonas_danica.AAC.51